jgi:hypothetical protein
MAQQTAGQTTHFIVQYDDAIGAPALAVANDVLAICELDLLKLTQSLPSHTGGLGDPFLNPKVVVNIVNDPLKLPGMGGAQNFGFSPGRPSLILINAFSSPNVAITADFAGFLFVAEMSELLMGFYGWDAASSQGEALSRVMAEELHPVSSSNFVNTWLGWPRPRPDWISRSETDVGGLSGRGDLDPIAYGCGIIFIYFLRYQHGVSYLQICTVGGSLLSDRYRALTGATDDPATRVGTLLDKHFGTGPINLVGNNPFPLYEGADRKVILDFGKRQVTNHLLPESGEARVKPFFSCPFAVYPYTEFGSSITQTITATTVGIGFPSFNWRINGQTLFASQIGKTVTAPVAVPDPQNPDQPQNQTQIFTFDYQIKSQFTAAGGSSALTLTSRSFAGDYQLELHVDADETAVPTVPVVAEQSLTYHTRTVVYGGSYAADRERCAKAFEKAMSTRVHAILPYVNLLHTLPDPPPPGYLPVVLEAVENIRQELAHIATTDHPTATKLAQYVATQVGVPAHIFLKGAHGGGPAISEVPAAR